MTQIFNSINSDKNFWENLNSYKDMTDGSTYFIVELSSAADIEKQNFYLKLKAEYFLDSNKFLDKNTNFHLYFEGNNVSTISIRELDDFTWRCGSEVVPFGLQCEVIRILKLDKEKTYFESWPLGEDEAEVCIFSEEWSEIQKRKVEEDKFFKDKKFLYYDNELFFGNVKWSRISSTKI